VLFESPPSIHRAEKLTPWAIYNDDWNCPNLTYISAGAYLAASTNPFNSVPEGTNLDIQIGVEFTQEGKTCILHLRGDTPKGKTLVRHLASLSNWGKFVTLKLSS
jgi:hypothetical protein